MEVRLGVTKCLCRVTVAEVNLFHEFRASSQLLRGVKAGDPHRG